ncbi:MAG: ydcV 2 [Cryptosporangiaceae bacterium]|jgi:putative spermidine/putrescine transport system permease protein|nr:ydcV 2 [Cryptosporangiaceae bacterium]
MKRAVLWVFVALVVSYLVLPALVVVPMSFNTSPFLQFPPPGYTTQWYEQFFADPEWTDAVLLSVRVAAFAALIAVLTGTAMAYALVRGGLRFPRSVETLSALPMVVPVIIYGAGAYVLAIGLSGVSSTVLLAVAHGVLAVPFVVINVRAALETTDSRLELAAQTLGASPFTAFRTVVLPLIAPAVASGGLLSLVLSLDETVVALFLTDGGSQTLPVKMFSSISYQLNPLVPVAASVMLSLTVVLGLTYLGIRLVARIARPRTSRRGVTLQEDLV